MAVLAPPPAGFDVETDVVVVGAGACGLVAGLRAQEAGAGVIGVGAGISLGDRLRSNATGLGLIVFKDQSSVKLGPNSNLTIDEFVYSPGSNGNFGITMDRGVSRFFGGQVSKKGEMKITTPHVILGVRGGIVDTQVDGGETTGILRAGKLTDEIPPHGTLGRVRQRTPENWADTGRTAQAEVDAR